MYKYHLISFWFANIYQGEVPQYGICSLCGPIHIWVYVFKTFDIPQNWSVSESMNP